MVCTFCGRLVTTFSILRSRKKRSPKRITRLCSITSTQMLCHGPIKNCRKPGRMARSFLWLITRHSSRSAIWSHWSVSTRCGPTPYLWPFTWPLEFGMAPATTQDSLITLRSYSTCNSSKCRSWTKLWTKEKTRWKRVRPPTPLLKNLTQAKTKAHQRCKQMANLLRNRRKINEYMILTCE